ncbi:MAG: SH3 domain-containing protein [Deltaproteobacteria bacterium]|nr:SH3 domain-containing protein [Deltaproteobacteria bacterium]
MVQRWIFFVVIGCLGLLMAALACGPTSQRQSLHKVRVQIPLDPKQPRLDEKFLAGILQKALSCGLQLGYRVVYANAEMGIISFSKEVSPEHVPIILNVEIQKESEKSAYADIILQSPRNVDDSHLNEFKNALAARIKRPKEEVAPPVSPTPPPSAPESPAAKGEPQPKAEPANAEPKLVPEEKPSVPYSITAKGGARLRSQPNTNSKILTTVKTGTKVEKIDQDGGWLKVKAPSGETGWILKSLVKEEKRS